MSTELIRAAQAVLDTFALACDQKYDEMAWARLDASAFEALGTALAAAPAEPDPRIKRGLLALMQVVAELRDCCKFTDEEGEFTNALADLGAALIAHPAPQPQQAGVARVTPEQLTALRRGLHTGKIVPPAATPPQAPAPAPQAQAVQDVLAERQRQISVEGWTSEHDDEHSGSDMAMAAAAYAAEAGGLGYLQSRELFPWSDNWWKPKDARRNLVKAGALILAEIERLDRASAAQKPTAP